MDPRLLHYYNRELRHLREIGGEFAAEYPKIAGRLGLESFECADPYVERLLEGFAFLAARVQLKVDAEFPAFTQHLLEVVYPHYLSPTPSMAVVQMQPDPNEGTLVDGFVVPRGTSLRSQIGKGEQTACEYRTAHEVTLWPIQVVEGEYLTGPAAIANLGAPSIPGAKAAIRLRLRATAGLTLNQIGIDELALFLHGSGALPVHIYEQLRAHALGVVAISTQRPANWNAVISHSPLPGIGFDDSQALLPYGPRSFQGYRLLHEYFAFPERFQFVNLKGLRVAFGRCGESEVDLLVSLDRVCPQLVNALDASHFALFCTPAINLFPKRTDRIHLTSQVPEYHVLADRTRPMDYEIYAIEEVTGYGENQEREQTFQPFYGSKAGYHNAVDEAYYALHRRKRVLSSRQRREGLRTSYVGHEVYVSLVDAAVAPYSCTLKQLGLKALCTNRDLPLLMPVGVGDTDFTLQTGAPVQSIRCLVGPTKPRPSPADGESAWRLINHLSLNYLMLVDQPGREGGTALRDLLTLYADFIDPSLHKQISGLLAVSSRNVVRRIDAVGPIVFGRGLEITVKLEESAFEGSGVFPFGAVLDHFFARYASINTFTETVIQTSDRGEVMRWPIRIGQRHTL